MTETKMTLTEAHYQETDWDSNRKGGAIGTMIYVVQKRMDGNSAALETAITTGKAFQSAIIKLVQGNATVTYKLSNVSLTPYTAHYVQGKPAIEEFVVRFQSKTLDK